MTATEKDKNIPELRFPEFEGELYQNLRLRKVCSINPKNEKLPKNFIYIDLESVNKGRLEKEVELSDKNAPSRAQRILMYSDILFQTVRPYQKNNLYFDKTGSYVASTGYAQLRCFKIDSLYLFQLLHTTKFVNEVLRRCTGTSYPAVNSNDLATIYINIPNIPEQQKIATFLTAVDKRIHLLTRKKEKLEHYKKGVMQQLFSRELRFKDDNGNEFPEWEEKRLGEVGNIKSGLSKEQNSNNKGYKVTRIETISEGVINFQKVGYVDNIDDIENFRLIKGDILFSNINSVSHIGKTAIVKEDIKLYHGMNLLCIRSNNKVLPQFLHYYLNTKKLRNYFKSICNKAVSQASINQTALSKTKIIVPSIIEQQKIASFLSAIDKQIEQVTHQIEHSNQWKKGLLQKMFV